VHYSNWDINQTCHNAKQVLRRVNGLREEVSHLKLETSLSAIQYDGMPKGDTNENGTENALIRQIAELDEDRYRLEHQIIMVEKTLDVMGEPTQEAQQLSTLLQLRYLERLSVRGCCERLADLFNLDYISESKFHRDEREALLLFTRIYPERDALIVHIDD